MYSASFGSIKAQLTIFSRLNKTILFHLQKYTVSEKLSCDIKIGQFIPPLCIKKKTTGNSSLHGDIEQRELHVPFAINLKTSVYDISVLAVSQG